MTKNLTLGLWAVLAATMTVFAADDPIQTQRKVTGGGNRFDAGGGANIVAPKLPQREVQIINYTAVSPMREWTNQDGNKMTAHLLAFSVPPEGKDGPIIVIADAKVRFLLDGKNRKPIDYPLEKLSEEDQKFIQNIAKQAKEGVPKVPKPVKLDDLKEAPATGSEDS